MDNVLDKIIKFIESSKSEVWLLNYPSKQKEVIHMKQQLINEVKYRYDNLSDKDRQLVDGYIKVHHQLKSLKYDIEGQGIVIDIAQLPYVQHQMLENTKSDEHRKSLVDKFKKLHAALKGQNHLNTKLNLCGTKTLRITTQNYNVQGLPKPIQNLILPTQFKKVFMIDFKSFDPSVVAYITKDPKLIYALQQPEGVYGYLLSNLQLDKSHRTLVKKAFIGSYLFGGLFNSEKFKLNHYVDESEWRKVTSQFKKVEELKKLVSGNQEMPMPYGIRHDMRHSDTKNLMPLYIQTAASYIFKYVLLDVYQKQVEHKNFRIIMPIHDAIIIECNDKSIADNLGEFMEEAANKHFGQDLAKVTVDEIGGMRHE